MPGRAIVLHAMGVMAVSLLLLGGCGSPPNPLTRLVQNLSGVPTFSIVLADMHEEGNFFKKYYHKYQVVMPENTTSTDWLEVPDDFFQQNLPFLGMTIYVKKDGQSSAEVGPPGYEYVGDPKYGSWQRDSSGNSFWAFYGQYALLSHLLGGGPIYRNNWDTYQTHRGQGRPYYGPNREYGTEGSYTRKTKPDFYNRRMTTMNKAKSSFSDKVNQRTGRSSSSARGRSSGVGK
jgi:hypothetical protein